MVICHSSRVSFQKEIPGYGDVMIDEQCTSLQEIMEKEDEDDNILNKKLSFPMKLLR